MKLYALSVVTLNLDTCDKFNVQAEIWADLSPLQHTLMIVRQFSAGGLARIQNFGRTFFCRRGAARHCFTCCHIIHRGAKQGMLLSHVMPICASLLLVTHFLLLSTLFLASQGAFSLTELTKMKSFSFLAFLLLVANLSLSEGIRKERITVRSEFDNSERKAEGFFLNPNDVGINPRGRPETKDDGSKSYKFVMPGGTKSSEETSEPKVPSKSKSPSKESSAKNEKQDAKEPSEPSKESKSAKSVKSPKTKNGEKGMGKSKSGEKGTGKSKSGEKASKTMSGEKGEKAGKTKNGGEKGMTKSKSGEKGEKASKSKSGEKGATKTKTEKAKTKSEKCESG